MQPSPSALAWQDIIDGFGRNWMWIGLAIQDVKLRYRGSVLGPFWVTMNTLVMVAGMSFVYSHLFNMQRATYLPYLTIGLIIWQFIASTINDSCDTFIKAEGTIKQVPIPFSVYAYRGVCRNLLVLAHSLPIVPLAWAFFDVPANWHVLEIIPALTIVALNGVWVNILLGMMSARFRDVPPVIANVLQLTFLLTPVFWPVRALGHWQRLAQLNPFFAAIDVLRSPLLGMEPNESSWLVLLVVTGLGGGFTFVLFARLRSRIAYWI